MSNSTRFTKPNPNIFLCRWTKQARKFQIVVVLPSQILIYYCIGKQSESQKVSNSTDVLLCRQAKWAKKYEIIFVLPSQILIYYCVGEWSKPKNLKKVLNYKLSNSSSKLSNSTCCTKLNPNILLCRQVKQARKFKIIVVLPRQILMYYCVGKQSEPKDVKQYLFYQAKS